MLIQIAVKEKKEEHFMKKYHMVLASIVAMMVFSAPLFAAKEIGYETWGVINVNTATTAQLESLSIPGISINHELAENIIFLRNSQGPFQSLDDLMNVKGMTRTKLDDLRPWLVFQGETTYSPQEP